MLAPTEAGKHYEFWERIASPKTIRQEQNVKSLVKRVRVYLGARVRQESLQEFLTILKQERT